MVNPTSQRQSRPHDQPSDHPMTAPSVPEPALAWVRASDDTNTRARPNVEQFDPSHNVYPRITRRGITERRFATVAIVSRSVGEFVQELDEAGEVPLLVVIHCEVTAVGAVEVAALG